MYRKINGAVIGAQDCGLFSYGVTVGIVKAANATTACPTTV